MERNRSSSVKTVELQLPFASLQWRIVLLDEQVAASRMSRGDYIEYLLREKPDFIDEALAAAALAQQQQQAATPQTSFAPPVVEQEVSYVPPVSQPQPTHSDWNSSN